MPRHAGFAAAATITEKLINDIVTSFVKFKLGKAFFPLPQSVNVGGVTVSFSGLVEMLPPKIELHANPNNLVQVHFTFGSRFRAQVANQPMLDYRVMLTGMVNVQLNPLILNNQVHAAINLALVVLQPLNVQTLSGPALPLPVLAALQSPVLTNAAANFVQSLALFILTPPLLNTHVEHSVPGEFKEANFSVFEWFRISLNASQIVLKPMEHALTVAVDFAGFTQGDPNQLVDLTKVRGAGSIYTQKVTQLTNPKEAPILVRGYEPAGGSIAVTINQEMLAAVIDRQISPQISGTPITPDVKLDRISISYVPFDKPLRGREDALALNFWATVRGSIQASGRFLLQPYLRTMDGPTGFVGPDTWRIFVAGAEVNLPWWVDAGVVVLSIFFGALIPGLKPFLWVSTAALLGDIVPTLLDNVANQAKLGLQNGANGINFPSPWSGPISDALPKPRFDGMLRYISFTSTGIDLAIDTWINWSDRMEEPEAVIEPLSWSVYHRGEIPLSLKLREDLEKLAGKNLMIAWEVRRKDTNQLVVSAVKSYLDPGGNGPAIYHSSAELYFVDEYTVRALATLTLGSQVGEIWSGKQELIIRDPLNRRHKYLRWGPHRVYFKNEGTDDKWWSHLRRSRIHRTAVGARCKMLREQADNIIRNPTTGYITYSDELPFPWEDLNNHRKVLCEYCFFDGPEKSNPLPKEDWFIPLHELLKGLIGKKDFIIEDKIKRFPFQ